MKKIRPMPSNPTARQLCEIFGQYLWSTIVAENQDARTKPAWKTQKKFEIRPRVLWALHQDANKLVGVRFGTHTEYALLDIDADSIYCHGSAIEHIQQALETIGITRTVAIRSSFSGGIHLYLPLPSPVKTFDLALALERCLEGQGFKIKPGTLEVFPNKKRFGAWWLGEFVEYNAHRLPLQPGTGSVLLDGDLNPHSHGRSLAELFERWAIAAHNQDEVQLASALAQAKSRFKETSHPYRNLHRAEEWRRDMEIEISEGWTGTGQTNALLKAIACYGRVFERLEGADLEDYVYSIAVTRPGYLDWCRHHHEIKRKCTVWARAAESYYWPFGTAGKREKPPTVNQNTERSQDAIERIKQAIASLTDALALPEEITARAQAIAHYAHVSLKTLYRYLHLWHPQHWQRCKTPDTASNTGDLGTPEPEPPDPVRSRDSGQFYTLGGDMKRSCAFETVRDEKSFDPVGGGSPGGVIHRPRVFHRRLPIYAKWLIFPFP